MKQSEPKAPAVADRRGFLKLAAAGTVTGSVSIAAGVASAAPAPASADDGLYRETEHIKRYYDLARF